MAPTPSPHPPGGLPPAAPRRPPIPLPPGDGRLFRGLAVWGPGVRPPGPGRAWGWRGCLRAPLGLARTSLALAAFAGSPGSLPLPSTPPLPGWLQGAMGGPVVGEARRQPPAIIGSWDSRAIGRRLGPRSPGPWRILDEGRLLHHLRPSPPGPRAAGSLETGASTRNRQKAGL